MRRIRGAARRLGMGLATLAGWPQGFFSPYRYAAEVAPPAPYPAIEAAFRAAEANFSELLDAIEAHGPRLSTFDGPPPEPRWGQVWFPRLDGAAAYVLARGARRIVEVGSGHSTRIMARAARDAGSRARLTCIDPAPRAAVEDLPVELYRRVLGEADLALFEALGEGDIAFFDSSHLLWPGSDVDIMLNRILPLLRRGVLVHIHDVTLPDPYPAEWAWRGYTEQHALSGWILGGAYQPVFASHYALTRMGAARRPGVAALPLPPGAFETSLWLRRA